MCASELSICHLGTFAATILVLNTWKLLHVSIVKIVSLSNVIVIRYPIPETSHIKSDASIKKVMRLLTLGFQTLIFE